MKILIVADEPKLLEFLEGVFVGRKHEVRAFVCAASGIDILRTWQPDVLLCDLDLAAGHAEDLAWLVARLPAGLARPARILLMSCDPYRLARHSRAADDVLLKPFSADELLSLVELAP